MAAQLQKFLEQFNMQIYIDNDYVTTYAEVGELVDGIEVNTPQDLDHFKTHYQAYKVIEDELVFDENKEAELELEAEKDMLRRLREVECFSVVDRSIFWYNSLTQEQQAELKTWYDEWLVVTETLVIPTKPAWL